MANSKKKTRPSGSTRPGTSPGRKAAPTKVDTPVTVTPGEPGGPNRAARKEEARRQREALQRKMARRRYYRIGGPILAVVVVGAAIGIYAVTRPDPAKEAGCGDVATVKPYKTKPADDRSHIGGGGAGGAVATPPNLSTYSSFPPASGPHDPVPLASGVYPSPPDVYKTIHSLEHGAVIIWYAPGAGNGSALTGLTDFYRQPSNQDHVIVAPYSYPDQGSAGLLPAGSQIVMVAWHHMESCQNVSLAAAKSFVAGYRVSTGGAGSGYKGDAPEPGSPL